MTSSPTPRERKKLVNKKKNRFKKSDESAYSMVPSRMSISTGRKDDDVSIISGHDIAYQRLSFEDDLFNGLVYKRNFIRYMIHSSSKSSILANRSPIHGSENRIDHRRGYRSRTSSLSDNTQIRGRPSIDYTGYHQGSQNRSSIQHEEPLAVGMKGSPTLSTSHNPDGIVSEVNNFTKSGRPSFLNACKQGDYDAVDFMLKNKDGLNTYGDFTSDHDRETFRVIPCNECIVKAASIDNVPSDLRRRLLAFGLLAAVMLGHIEIVQLLLTSGACLEDERLEDDGLTDGVLSVGSQPLHVAAESGNVPLMRLLLQRGASISARNFTGEQPVHIASRKGHYEALCFLCEVGAKLNEPDLYGYQPLHILAKSSNQPDIIELLVSKGSIIDAEIPASGERPLNLACRMDWIGNVQVLLSLRARLGRSGCGGGICPFTSAIHNNSYLALEAMLEHGVSPNHEHHFRSIIHRLIDRDQDRHCDWPNTEWMLQLLTEYHVDLNAKDWCEEGNTVLHKLASNKLCYTNNSANKANTLRIAEFFLANKADPNRMNVFCETPLWIAAKARKHKFCRLLVDWGANLVKSVADPEEKTNLVTLHVKAADESPTAVYELHTIGSYAQTEMESIERLKEVLNIAEDFCLCGSPCDVRNFDCRVYDDGEVIDAQSMDSKFCLYLWNTLPMNENKESFDGVGECRKSRLEGRAALVSAINSEPVELPA